MTTVHLAREYDAWLDANPALPRNSADEVLHELIEPAPAERTPEAMAQIDWLLDFIARWEKAQ